MIEKIKEFIRFNFCKPKDNGKWYKVIDVYVNPSTGENHVTFDNAIAMKKEDI